MRSLDGIQVLDFGRYIAGPYCASLLADLGARVIRVELPKGAEDRQLTPFTEDAGAMFMAANRNKLSMTLDTRTPAGRTILGKLVAVSDVVVANLPPKALTSLGLDLASLRQHRPDVVLTTISAYATTSDLRDKPGFDGIGQALCGSAYLSGTPQEPVRAAVSWVDFGTAALAAFGTVAALRDRDRTGLGQQVDASLTHTAMAFASPALLEQAALSNHRTATGNRGPQAAPSDIIATRDGWIIVCAVGDAMFSRWAELMGDKDRWLSDDRFRDDASRGAHGVVISARLQQWAADLTTREALQKLTEAKLPAAEVNSPAEALQDADLLSACRVYPVDYPGIGHPIPAFPSPVQLLGAQPAPRGRPPTLGQDTRELLRELGYSDTAITEFRSTGSV